MEGANGAWRGDVNAFLAAGVHVDEQAAVERCEFRGTSKVLGEATYTPVFRCASTSMNRRRWNWSSFAASWARFRYTPCAAFRRSVVLGVDLNVVDADLWEQPADEPLEQVGGALRGKLPDEDALRGLAMDVQDAAATVSTPASWYRAI